MNEHLLHEAQPFLAAIAERPGDALPRLMFADWLEERGYDQEASDQRLRAFNGGARWRPESWRVGLRTSEPRLGAIQQVCEFCMNDGCAICRATSNHSPARPAVRQSMWPRI